MTRQRLKFFFPDAVDQLDRSFDFEKEKWSPTRVRQRDDSYAHEVFSRAVYDGMLVSKGIVDRVGGGAGRYSVAQRQRFRRLGGREFLRLTEPPLPIMGDCGAFTYVNESTPPFSVDEVLAFYMECDANFGLSVDHVILAYKPKLDAVPSTEVPEPLRERQELTVELAADFFRSHDAQRLPFTPVGVAQGWSPQSYAAAVSQLQQIGYDYIALGGLVPLKTPDILSVLEAVRQVRAAATRLHLLGVTRLDAMPQFPGLGVASFDSTSPLRQAFKDTRDNYYTPTRTYPAIRVPQVEKNADLKKRIVAGQVSQDEARHHERECLDAMKRYDAEQITTAEALKALRAYEKIHHPGIDRSEEYAEVLRDRPWAQCPCEICADLGHHVILFRGAERNRSRGFHNLWTFYNRLLDGPESDGAAENVAVPDSMPRDLLDSTAKGQPATALHAEASS